MWRPDDDKLRQAKILPPASGVGKDRAEYSAAKRQEDDLSTLRTEPVGFRSVGEYLADADGLAAKKAFWQDILCEGDVSLLVGRALAGKSTFACVLTRALTMGIPLFGRRCVKARVGYMALERNGRTVARLLDAWDLRDVAFLDQVPRVEMAKFLSGEIERLKLEVIIVDHLQNLARVGDANDYAKVSGALEPFQVIAKRTGCHLMLLHHQPKTRREGEIDCMGSEAYRAAADVLIEATRSGDAHFIRGQIRGKVDLPKTRITVSLDSGDIAAVDAAEAEVSIAKAAVRDFLSKQEESLPEAAIRDGISVNANIVSAALRAGVRDGGFARTGAGKKGDPFLYRNSECSTRGAQGTADRESGKDNKPIVPSDEMLYSKNRVEQPTSQSDGDEGFEI